MLMMTKDEFSKFDQNQILDITKFFSRADIAISDKKDDESVKEISGILSV